MRLFVEEKLLSLHNKYFILNENRQQVFEISSEVISIGDKTTIFDMRGNKVSYIEQEILHFMPHYNVYVNNMLFCKINKKFILFKNDYELSNGFRVEGSFMALDFKIYDERNVLVASISRKFLSLGDKYTIDIFDDRRLVEILSIIVCITNDIDRSQNSSSSS